MPIEIIRLLAFEGPHMLGPQPGVLLEVRAARDLRARLRSALKDAAQSAGVVVGALEVGTLPEAGAYTVSASFTTPTPALGAAIARYVVDGLDARERGDDSWDAEGLLWELQRRRRAEALPVAALQLLAEAATRHVPAFVRADGALQLGYGVRGRSVALAALRSPTLIVPGEANAGAPALVWEEVGAVPIIALTGSTAKETVRLVAGGLHAQGIRAVAAVDASFDQARALLTDPVAEALVVGLEAGDLLRRGLPFERCAASVVLGLPDEPPEARGRTELARALGVAMLVTDPGGVAALDASQPELAALAEYAPCRVELVRSAREAAEAILDWEGPREGRALP
jgi:hypothetical protein